MNLNKYTYERYEADWQDLRGHTCYWFSGIGYAGMHVSLMDEEEFDEAKSKLHQALVAAEAADNVDDAEMWMYDVASLKIPLLLAGKITGSSILP